MDREKLVSLVTRLVAEELAKGAAAENVSSAGGQTALNASPARRLLICGAPGSYGWDAAWKALRTLADTHYIFVDWPGFPWERTPQSGWGARSCEVVGPPEYWDGLLSRADAVLLPAAPLEVLAKISQLITDVPPAAAAVAGLLRGMPVYIGSGDADRWTERSANTPGAVKSLIQAQVRAVQGMGAFIDTPDRIAARLLGGTARMAPVSGSGREVVTNEDIMALVRAGNTVLETEPGCIVTSLARETAARYGIEIRLR